MGRLQRAELQEQALTTRKKGGVISNDTDVPPVFRSPAAKVTVELRKGPGGHDPAAFEEAARQLRNGLGTGVQAAA